MENKKIQEFGTGEIIQGFYLIKSADIRTAANNNKYMDFTLSDRTGEINAKLWDYDEEVCEGYVANTLIKVRGTVTEWQGRLQLRIERIRLSNQEDGLNLEDFVTVAPLKPEDMMGTISEYIMNMRDGDIKEIIRYALNEKKEKLMHYPAAMKNHHSIRSGLLYHIVTMLTLAERVCQVYPQLDTDLLYAGVILHDLEKLNEMDANELGIVSGYTMEGVLLGHIVQGITALERIGEAVGADSETVILLQHMLLSHHYEPEFGSPKRPMIPEAEILHYLDVIDARMYDMDKALQGVEQGEFSEKIWVLHNRQLYKHIPKD